MKRAGKRARTLRGIRRRALGASAWLAIAVLVCALPAIGLAADGKDGAAAGAPASAADIAKLQQQVNEQRQLTIQMLQMEQQRYDMLLRLLQSGGQLPPGSVLAPAPALPPATHAGGATAAPTATSALARVAPVLATVTGKVQSRAGTLKDAYVYVDLLKAPSAHGHRVEIKQKGHQFSPQVAVVQRGTSVVFPNMDAVFHNVFSQSPHNTFDLGSYRAGDTPRSVTLTSPGVVDVFCNYHSEMNAAILVVPNPLFTKVAPDGSFRLENVPAGPRRLVAWSPNAKPAPQKIDVTPGGAQAIFTLDYDAPRAHTNKLGQPYGSYKE
jgi:plastocyanin